METIQKRNGRLLICMPPRHGKSFLASQYFPAWYLGTHPSHRLILTSYESEFASQWGRKVRDILDDCGQSLFNVSVRQDSKAADRWELAGTGGGMQTTGIGSALTGKGCNCLVIDDPVKNSEEASSELIRQKTWDWYTSTAYTRLEPGGSVILIQTRWHCDDLAGRVLERAKETGEPWEVVNLPAIAEENDPIGRQVGEPLWPQRYTVTDLNRIKATLGSYQFASLFQQRPTPEGGGLFKKSWFRYYDRHGDIVRLHHGDGHTRSFDLRHCRIVVCLDPAFSTKAEADFSVLMACAITPDADVVVLDMHRERMTGDQLGPAISRMMESTGAVYCAIEDVAAQTLIVQEMRRKGLVVRSLRSSLDKVTRALPTQIKMEAEQVYFPRFHPVLEALEHELLTFPKGAHDDCVDVLAYQCLDASKFGPACLPLSEMERIERERLDREWAEKVKKDQAALQDADHDRWWDDSNWN